MNEGAEASSRLSGKRIAITRPPDRTAPLAALLESHGAELAAYPLIRIESPGGGERGLEMPPLPLSSYDWVVVTSAHATATLESLLGGAPWPPGVRVAAVGSATADALARAGIPVDLIPPHADAAALAAAMTKAGVIGPRSLADRRILFPRSDRARRDLPDELKAAGALVDEIDAYRTVLDLDRARELRRALGGGAIAALVFTSPSNVEALAEEAAAAWPAVLAGIRVVATGKATAAELAGRGRPADAVATTPDPEGLLEALRAVVG